MKQQLYETDKDNLLLRQFNNREACALEKIYNIHYLELMYFTNQLYRGTNIEACDVIHDVYIRLWESKMRFEGINNIKAYIYVSIKNSFYNAIKHNKTIDKYNYLQRLETKNFISDIIESETLSVINDVMKLLPEHSARLFKCMIDGWDMKDIATELGRSSSYVYAKREEIISLLRKKIDKNSIFINLIMSGL